MPGQDLVPVGPHNSAVAKLDAAAVRTLAEEAQSYAELGRAANTRRAYGSDWADFSGWCASVGAVPLPAEAATLALYLTARAPTHAASTLARRLAAIRTAHREAGHAPPDHGDLRRVWSGIRRAHGRPPRKKRALVTEDLKRAIDKTPTNLAGLRDRAVLLFGFASALRRSELASLELGGGTNELRFVAGGAELWLGRSKGDQEGHGQLIAVPYGKTKYCPVRSVEAWLQASGVKRGPVFRSIDRHGHLGIVALSGQAIATIVKAAADRVKLDPAVFAGHSLRAGLVTSALGRNVGLADVQRQTRHAKVDTLLGYDREAQLFKRNAAGKVGL
jgi:site-specific recombinase XerD